jgi:type IV pilus assembly protein PilO
MPLKNRNLLTALFGCIMLTLGIVYVYSSYFYGPLRKDIVQDQKSLEDLKGKLQHAEDRARQLSRMQQEMAGLQVDVAQLQKQLPKDRELPALIRVLTHRAESHGLILGTVTPGKAVTKGLYDEIPYSVTVTSSFHGLGHFLTSLGKGERLFAARNLALTPMANRTDPSKTVNATFQLIAFKYRG